MSWHAGSRGDGRGNNNGYQQHGNRWGSQSGNYGRDDRDRRRSGGHEWSDRTPFSHGGGHGSSSRHQRYDQQPEWPARGGYNGASHSHSQRYGGGETRHDGNRSNNQQCGRGYDTGNRPIPKKSRPNSYDPHPLAGHAAANVKTDEEEKSASSGSHGAMGVPHGTGGMTHPSGPQAMDTSSPAHLPSGKDEKKPKAFADMTRKEKFQSQYRYMHFDWSTFPQEAFVEETDVWKDKKKAACEHAAKKVMERMHENALEDIKNEEEQYDEELIDDDSDDDPMYSSSSKSKRPEDLYPYSNKQISRFLEAVQDCVFLTVGFDVLGIRAEDDKHCYCPCGGDMIKWQEQFNLRSLLQSKDKEKTCRQKMDPLGIMGHIRTLAKRCTLHYALMVYMECLYCKDHGSYRGGVGHKAMYQLNDTKYRRAEAAEKRERHENYMEVSKQLMEEQNKRRKAEHEKEERSKQLELLKKVNEDHFEKIQLLEKIKKPEESKEEQGLEHMKEVVISKEMLGVYRNMFHSYFNSLKKMAKSRSLPASLLVRQISETDGPLEIQIPVNKEALNNKVDLQKCFDTWYSMYLKKGHDANNATLLFCDLDLPAKDVNTKNYYGYKIMNDWNVKYPNPLKYGRTKKAREQKEQDKVIDEGGATRDFLSQCWSQLGDLGVTIGANKEKVLLFERCPVGVQPQKEERLKQRIKDLSKTDEVAWDDCPYLKRATAYYRAVGRILLHSMATGHTISSAAMPPFYQNYLFRGCSPGDSDYDLGDIITHLFGLGSETTKKDWELIAKEDSVEGSAFDDVALSKSVYKHFLEPRKKVLNAIKDGLTLGGDVAISDIFKPIPLNGVQKLVFSTPAITAKAIINVLQPRYCVDFPGIDLDIPAQQEIQEEFFNNTLCRVLEDREEASGGQEFLSLFVYFCTGSNYLPDPDGNPDYKIEVEFNSEEMELNAHPKSHTCVFSLVLPGQLYSSRDDFEQKLEEALTSSEIMPFMMN